MTAARDDAYDVRMATADPLIRAADKALKDACRSLRQAGKDPRDFIFVLADTVCEPGRSMLVESLVQDGKSTAEANEEADRRALNAATTGTLDVICSAFDAAVYAAADGLPAHLASKLRGWCPPGDIRVITRRGPRTLLHFVRVDGKPVNPSLN